MLVRTGRLAARVAPAPVVVVGGDSIVGNALKLLLRGSGYAARFEVARSFDARRVIQEADLVLLAPGLQEWDREAVLSSVETARPQEGLPVLELVSVTDYRPEEGHALVPWPCRTEDLEREVEDVLGGREARVGLEPAPKKERRSA